MQHDAVITILDLGGREVKSDKNYGNTNLMKIDLSDLKEGEYFVKIRAGKKMITRKVMLNF